MKPTETAPAGGAIRVAPSMIGAPGTVVAAAKVAATVHADVTGAVTNSFADWFPPHPVALPTNPEFGSSVKVAVLPYCAK